MRRLITVIGFLFCVFNAYAQKLPDYWNEIAAFQSEDKQVPPAQHAILFIGSSSFRMWKNVNAAFPGYPIINRGFGGSRLPDVIGYFYDIILPYHPKQIVIYCGENDLMEKDITAREVATRFETLFCMIRKNLPDAMIDFVSIKPSPSRIQVRDLAVASNQMIKNYITSQSKAKFIDVYSKMLDENGNVIKGIFREDMLHLNDKGYAIWQKAILPYLMK